jgi:AraC family transcriptional regulator, transcriptional activator FtrA
MNTNRQTGLPYMRKGRPMNKGLKKTVWIIGYTLSALAGIALAATIGISNAVELLQSPAPEAVAAAVIPLPAPSYDASKPTVAILLSNTQTESSDFLMPYAMFAESGAYNVYAVAETRGLRTLTGGVDVVPQRSFAELDAQLQHRPDIIVVPAMNAIGSPQNEPVLDWLRQHGQAPTLLFSWCSGAEVLAASGLIDGKTVTTHWGNIDAYEQAYPAVHWQRGERYIDSGTLLTTGGITSGVDATLHLLARRNGQAVADKVALALHYPASPFVANPHMAQYTQELADSIFVLNLAFTWPKQQTGVWLYDGIGEVDLAAVDDVYTMSSTDQTYTVAEAPAVVSRHGLQIVPRWQAHNLPTMDRLLVPGGDGAEQVAARLPNGLGGGGVPVTVLQNDHTPEYAFTIALQDLASTHDIPSAVFAAKRLEVRSPLQLVGTQWPVHLLIIPVLAGMGGATAFGSLVWFIRRARTFIHRNRNRASAQTTQPQAGGA